ncbi:Zinc finger protein GLIS2 like [Schistosoma japonicum]|nr:Zinc finger protein GLIS2 like [Schistosoma japonicum]
MTLDIYTASPGLPQDLSCRKQFAISRIESQKLPAIQEDSEACLPSITTFSHHRQGRAGSCSYTSIDKSTKFAVKKRQKQLRSKDTENMLYCDWPQCPRFILKQPFKQMAHLKRHLLLHKNHLNLTCSQCEKRFSSKENLKRHTCMHLGLKPYACPICHQTFSRTSERSMCLKKHHFEKDSFEKNKPCWNASGLSALQIEDKINRSRPRPYICRICEDCRAYTDPSSLRKHMRSFHGCSKNEKAVDKDDSISENVSKPEFSETLQCEEPISLVLETSVTDIDAVDSSQLTFDNSFTTESKSLVLVSESVYSTTSTPCNFLITSVTSEIPTTNMISINNKDSNNNNTPMKNSNVSTNIIDLPKYHLLSGSDSIAPSTSMLVISTRTVTTDATTSSRNEYDSEVAVDLCNSALCLQVYSDKTHTSIPSSEFTDSVTVPLSTSNFIPQYASQSNRIFDNGLTSKSLFYSNSGLDLTDAHYFTLTGSSEAIDLSSDPSVDIITMNPIDLSASQHCTMFFESTNECTENGFFTTHAIWDPEPGFSFTDLLLTNNDYEYDADFSEVKLYPENAVYRSNDPETFTTNSQKNTTNKATFSSNESVTSNILISSRNHSFHVPSNTKTPTTSFLTEGGKSMLRVLIYHKSFIYSSSVKTFLSQSNIAFNSDSQSCFEECVNLTPFGEFLVWTPEAVIWLRRNYRVIGRASLPLELSGKTSHGHQSKNRPDRLPVRLSFEEVCLLLSKGFIHGILCSRPVLCVGEPPRNATEAYHNALLKNAEEMINIFKTQRRLKLVGYYRQLLSGIKLRQQRKAKSTLFTPSKSPTYTIDNDNCSNNRDTTTRKRRRRRRLMDKHLKKQMRITGYNSVSCNDSDHEFNIYDSDEASFELPNIPITLDDLISEHSTKHQGTSKLSIISNENIEECLPYIPQHLPRITPIEWRRPGEYMFVNLPETVFSEGCLSVIVWLMQLLQKQQGKSTNSSHHLTNNNNSSQDSVIRRLQHCFVYMDLWNKGYYISTSTVKMGGDLLVYQGDPLLYHGSHIVAICNPVDSFPNSQLLAKLRIANGLKKTLVLAAVSNIEMFIKRFIDQTTTNDTVSFISSQVSIDKHSGSSVQSEEIAPNDDVCCNFNSQLHPTVIYISLQYMFSHSSNVRFPKLL